MKKIFDLSLNSTLKHTCICFISAIIQVGVAFIYQLITETALDNNLRNLIIVGFIAIIYVLLDSVADFLPRFTGTRMVQSIMNILRNRLNNKISSLDNSELLTKDNKEITTKLVNDLTIIETEFLQPLSSLLLSAFMFIFSLIFSLKIEIRLTFLMILLAFIPLLSPYLSKKILSNKRKQVLDKQNKYFVLFEQMVNYLSTLKLSGGVYRYYNIIEDSNVSLKKSKIDFNTSQGLTYSLSYLLGALAYSGTWVLGGFFVYYQKISLPQLIAMTTLMGTIAGPLQHLSSSITELVSSKKITLDFLEYTEISNDNKISLSPKKELDIIYSIQLKNINYNTDNKNIFKDLNLTFEREKKYAIVGNSGSGKTTLLNIIMGLITPNNGEVYFNSLQLTCLNNDTILNKISYAKQNPDIFTATISDNISIFDEYNEEKLNHSLTQSGLSDWIHNNDIISPNGEKSISGGESKRIEIARAIYKNSDIILFDEPTSNLDKYNENLIADLIGSFENKIVIVVTHSNNNYFLDKFDEVISL